MMLRRYRLVPLMVSGCTSLLVSVKLAKGNTFGTSTRGCKSGNAGPLPDIENTSRASGHANPTSRLVISHSHSAVFHSRKLMRRKTECEP